MSSTCLYANTIIQCNKIEYNNINNIVMTIVTQQKTMFPFLVTCFQHCQTYKKWLQKSSSKNTIFCSDYFTISQRRSIKSIQWSAIPLLYSYLFQYLFPLSAPIFHFNYTTNLNRKDKENPEGWLVHIVIHLNI